MYRKPICAPHLVSNPRWSKKCGKNNHIYNRVLRAISLLFVLGDEEKCQPCRASTDVERLNLYSGSRLMPFTTTIIILHGFAFLCKLGLFYLNLAEISKC